MSKVYFTNYSVPFGDDLLKKFERLIVAAGIDDIDFEDKFVAIKLHFGEWGNVSFVRNAYARVLAEHIKARGGKVFLTDASTLYAGYRTNAVDHLYNASWDGFNMASIGCPIIIADGLRGTDERIIPVEGAEYCKEAYIASAIAEADVIVTLAHCKGHEQAGYGGTLKTLGMGCASKKGKMAQHNGSIPRISTRKCVGCGNCMKACANNGVHVVDHKAVIDENNCVGCGNCFAYCMKGAIACKWDAALPVFNKKLAEYSKAALNGKPQFHVGLAIDVQPNCDCNGGHESQLVPDIGMFASLDPVSLDQAAVDAINQAPVIFTHEDHECEAHDHDVFTMVHPDADWEVCLSHAEKLGIGERKYEIISVK